MPAAVEEIDYLEDVRGPGIADLPEHVDRPPETDVGGEQVPQYPGWDLETVATFLQGTGSGIHMLIGQTERDWLMTKKDLERIAPPLTRIANRWEPALRLSPVADPLLVAHGFALYGWRSALERKRALRDQEEELESQVPRAGYARGPILSDDEQLVDENPSVNGHQDLDVDVDLEESRYFDQGDSREPRQ
jgi:hypothetical protein